MKLCRFLDPTGQPVFGFYDANRVAPCNSFLDKPLCDREFWSRFEELSNVYASLEPARVPWQARPTRLLPPLPTPEKIICIGLNYLDHAIETGATPPTEPVVFSKFATALVGDGDEIQLPRLSQQVDYEAELVVVIGKAAKQIAKEDAMQYVAAIRVVMMCLLATGKKADRVANGCWARRSIRSRQLGRAWLHRMRSPIPAILRSP